MTARSTEVGFTLVEMLVALAVFALLSAGGIVLLRSSLATQEVVSVRLDSDRSEQRIVALFQSDLSQAIARPKIGVGDVREPSLKGSASSISLVRDGWANPGDHPRSSLQRVSWTRQDDKVARQAHLYLDGQDAGEPATFATHIRNVRFRYRLADGNWSDSFTSNERQLLPAAVEMTVEREGGALTIVVALPPRGLEPEKRPVVPQAGAA